MIRRLFYYFRLKFLVLNYDLFLKLNLAHLHNYDLHLNDAFHLHERILLDQKA